jgi:hypothetical protein
MPAGRLVYEAAKQAAGERSEELSGLAGITSHWGLGPYFFGEDDFYYAALGY